MLGLGAQVAGAVAEPLDHDDVPAGGAQGGGQRVEGRDPAAVAGYQQHRAGLVLRHRVGGAGAMARTTAVATRTEDEQPGQRRR